MVRAALAVFLAAATAAQGVIHVASPKAVEAKKDAEASKRPSVEDVKAAEAKKEAEEEAKQARESKMAAVNKAVQLLKSLQEQIMKEGEAEAATYNKFACFCKDTTSEKSEAIKKGEDEKAALIAEINKKSSAREKVDGTLKKLGEKIKGVETDMKKLTEERKENLAAYEKVIADMDPALAGLKGAIKAVKESKPESLLQFQAMMPESVRGAVILADALQLDSAKRAAAVFLQAPDNDVPMEDYKFHSDGIISTLETLQKDFQKVKNDQDAAEVKSVHQYDMRMQQKQGVKKDLELTVEKNQKVKAQLGSEIAARTEQLSTVSATLLDDKDYLMTVSKMCADKALTWDQRSKARADELATLYQVTEVIENEVAGNTSAKTARLAQTGQSVVVRRTVAQNEQAMNYIEAMAEEVDAEGAAASFLQVQASSQDPRLAVAAILRGDGAKLKSSVLVSLAGRISSDPFVKVKGLIQELIEKLLAEAAKEANQKGFCDKAMADATQKRDFAAEAVASLNAEMATLESTTATLTEELEELADDIKELKAARKTAVADREEEAKENKATLSEANAGLSALTSVIDILDKFYKTMKKNTVDLSLAQQPLEDAPDSGFDNGEAYTGAQGEAGGILGMLDVMKSDFERTISETTKDEREAKRDHLKFMTQSGISLAEKETAEELKSKQNENAKARLEEAGESFVEKNKVMRGAVTELIELKPKCVQTAMSYEERVARREDEIESLKKALCIFGKYEEFGPEGAADGC